MQQGLRPLVQDENSLAALHRLPSAKTLGGGGSGGGGGSAGSGKGAAALPGLRKALGNITNNTSRGADSENAAPPLGKTPARRAPLGDITNNSTAQKGQQQQAHKAPLPSKPTALATQQQQQQATCRADAYAAEGGVERQAGWGWEQLERDRLQREDAESTQRLASLASLPSHGLPSFFPLWSSSKQQAQAAAGLPLPLETLPSLPPSPPLRHGGRRGSTDSLAAALSMPDDLGELCLCLPDVAFDLGDPPAMRSESGDL